MSDDPAYLRQPDVNATEIDTETFLVGPEDGEVYYLDEVSSALWRFLEAAIGDRRDVRRRISRNCRRDAGGGHRCGSRGTGEPETGRPPQLIARKSRIHKGFAGFAGFDIVGPVNGNFIIVSYILTVRPIAYA